MKNYTLLLLLSILFFAQCKEDDSPREKRYLDKIIIEAAKLEAWDILSGPEMTLTYKNGIVDSLSLSGGSEVFEDVVDAMLPLTFEDIAFELTDFMFFQVLDVDEFAADDVMYAIQFNPYEFSERGNPFVLKDAEWTIRIFWKTQ